MNADNNRPDEKDESSESSILKQEERTDKTLLGEFGSAALAGLFAFFSAVLTTVVEGHSPWRPFWLIICIICLVCAVGLIVKGIRNFGRSAVSDGRLYLRSPFPTSKPLSGLLLLISSNRLARKAVF
jgi:hypothetical protein